MDSIFSKPPDLPLASPPPELTEALFGKTATPIVDERFYENPNPWTSSPAADGSIPYVDEDAEEKEYGALFSELDKAFSGGFVSTTASRPAPRFQFTKRANEPTPAPTAKPKLRYEKTTIDGNLWNQGFDPVSGELVSMLLTFDESE